jgi:isoquinoline 1-oxidoreductase subunit beta
MIPKSEKTIHRRQFLKLTGVSGAMLALGFSIPTSGKAATLQALDPAKVLNLELDPFIMIDTAGKITLFNSRPDMGQGSYQAVPTLIAEELEVRLDQVVIQQTDGSKKYGNQLAGGSSSVRTSWLPLRKAGAAVREMLVMAAAQRWQVRENDCYAQDGKVYSRSLGKSLTYGELVEEASKLEVPQEPKLKDPKDFKLLGKSLPRLDVPMKVNGKAVFGIDVEVPGMLYASIERSPMIHGKVVKFDESKAKAVKGVQFIVQSERKMPHKTTQGVAVIADNYFAALQGRRALDITWDDATFDQISTEGYFQNLRALSKEEGAVGEEKGNFSQAFGGAAKKLEAQYETPFLAHAPLEPENAVVHVREGECEVWAPVQAPDWAVQQLAQYLGLPPEKIKINVTFLGGAFGRKAYYDYVLEAAYLSRQVKAPVKLIWTREDDMTQGPFRPGVLSDMKGGLDKEGKLIAFQHKIVSASIQDQVFGSLEAGKPDEWTIEGTNEKDSPYAIPNRKHSFVLAKTEIPIVWWRSVYASNNNFGHESFIDELAHAAGKDPMAFRLQLFAEVPRFKKVLEMVSEKSRWSEKLPAGKARGVAIARSFESICAHVITVSKNGNGNVKIEKVVSVIDCGQHVNPDNVRAQTEGNIVMGLTAAIKDPITIEGGKVVQQNFHNYRVLRINEMPKIDVHIVPSQEAPGGVGEPGLPPVAPALCNAIFALTGKRIRKLPFDLTSLKSV